MSAFFADVAWASLIVAVVLLLLAAVAFVVNGTTGSETARLYLEPLSTWCLVAVAVHMVGLAGAGDAGVLALGLSLLLAAAAALLRPAAERVEAAAPPARPEPPPPAPAPPPARASGSLWSHGRS